VRGSGEVVTCGFVRRAPSQRQLSDGDTRLHRDPAVREEEGEVSCTLQLRGGGKRARGQPPPEIGEGSGAPVDFDEDKRFPKLGGGPTEAAE
jgi:hypothetical protein